MYALIADYLDIPVNQLEPHKSLSEIDMDSLDFTEIIFELEEKYKIHLGEIVHIKDKVHCINDMVELVIELKNHNPS